MMTSNGDTETFNGHSKTHSNGVAKGKAVASKTLNGTNRGQNVNGSAANGPSPASRNLSPTYLGHSREEVSRLIIQALQDLGYTASASNLGQESGFELESSQVAEFRDAIMQGSWVVAESLLFDGSSSAKIGAENGTESTSRGLSLADHAQPDLMRFWLREQKFLELLEARQTHQALRVLRTELTPVNHDVDKLHFLSR